MIKVICKYAKLSDVPNLASVDYYKRYVRPLDYEFYLTPGTFYGVLGVTARGGIPWLYIIRHEDDNRIHALPLVLFEFGWHKIPSNWCMRITGPSGENIELLPETLASIDHWYERYIDEDPAILEAVSLIIHNNR